MEEPMAKATPKSKRNRLPKKSAVESVEKIGYDLVKTRPAKGKLATVRDYAKVTWEPWTREKGMAAGELIPSNERLLEFGVPCRMAYAVMLRTRAELIESHGKVDHSQVDEMVACFADTSEMLKGLVLMLDTAYLRVLASAAAFHAKGGKFPGVSAA
jgi:hypothetical protein